MASDVLCRVATPEDKPFLLDLWGRVYGDSPAYATRCLDIFAGAGNVLVAQWGAAPVAMLLMVPCHINGAPGAYLYALATEPARRGAGVMSALIAHSEALAHSRGAVFALLIPATAALYPYYQKRGYINRLRLRHVRLPLAGGGPGNGVAGLGNMPKHNKAASAMAANAGTVPFTQEAPTGVRLAQLRAQWLSSPAVCFGGESAALAAQDIAGEGTVLANSKDAYAVALPGKGALLVAELAASTNEAALALLTPLAAAHGLRQARVTLPLSSQLWAGKGVVRPAALLKPLSPMFCFDEQSYLRFAMDDAFVFGLPRA